MIEDPFKKHGPIRVADRGTHLAHADGKPFFYLADTAWSGALLSTDADWKDYLADRKSKGFTAIQFIVMAPWGAAYTDADGRTAFDPADPARINPEFFRRMDAKFDAINAAGLLAVPVLAWAAKFGHSARYNPGAALSTQSLESLVAYQVGRYRAHHVLWLLAGDGRYGGLRSWKWKRIARKVFADSTHAPVGLHPMGKHWPYSSFKREKWLNVVGYQTGHANDPDTLRWMHEGPPTQQRNGTACPIINLEPCYEGIRNWASHAPFTNDDVRRAMYASLLNAPTAGVTYGAHGVWSWETQAREPLNHAGSGVAMPWRQAAQLPGSFDVQRLAAFFASIDWWRLCPAPHLLRAQPGHHDISHFISAAATPARDLALFYLPRGGKIALNPSDARYESASWFDPRQGGHRTIEPATAEQFEAPDDQDWLLVLRAPAPRSPINPAAPLTP